MGQRAAAPNLFEFYVAAMIRYKFEVKLSYEDSSIANVIYVQPACSVSYTTLRVAPDFVEAPTNGLGIGSAAKTVGTNYISYSANITMSCYNTTGAVTCFSTDTPTHGLRMPSLSQEELTTPHSRRQPHLFQR